MADLPVLIAGAGPCGLVAALTLKQQGIPFVIIERATRSKFCANVGSGYDLAPTANDILSNRLGLERMNDIYANLSGMRIQTMRGKDIREVLIADMARAMTYVNRKEGGGARTNSPEPKFGTIGRADLLKMLLDALFPTAKDEREVLLCGASVQSYSKLKRQGATVVTVTLSDGNALEGRVLLACDGIHSAIRKQLHQDRKDELNFCKIVCYWGKCELSQGSKLQQEVASASKDGKFAIIYAGSGKNPGSFFGMQCKKEILWALLFRADKPPGDVTGDLTRRGGKVLDETAKACLLDRIQGRSELLLSMLKATKAGDITEAGLFDRKDNTLPYTDEECVVLMGDSAHPQSPFMGQGCNMAIVDAYVVATRLAKQSSIPEVLKAFDTQSRKDSVRKVIEKSRTIGSISVSTGTFTCWIMKMISKYLPESWMLAEIISEDQSNRNFVALLDQDFPTLSSRKEQTFIRSSDVGLMVGID